MLPYEDALCLVLSHTFTLGTEEIDLMSSLNRVLAQEVLADRDFPPFNRVTMDGIAIQASAFTNGISSFYIEQTQAAGTPQTSLTSNKNCIEVMTGAMLPHLCDAVIPYEQCEINDGIATVLIDQVIPGQNIHKQGVDGKANDVLLKPGQKITPAMIGTMASVGLHKVQVQKHPRIAICSTGDELVEINQTPLPHQIRRSNAYMLAAALQEENFKCNLFHLPDQPSVMAEELSTILQNHDVLILSGAVSKGKFDYVPEVLEQLGLQQVFHKVAQRPGKPLLYGRMPDDKIVFGLPGNPVSSFVCFQLYFRPWLYQSLQVSTKSAWAHLGKEITFKPDISFHVPVTIENQDGTLMAFPVDTSGSGDLTSLLKADALLTLPPHKEVFHIGEAYPLTYF